MDDALRQRLVGAAVIIALAVIFLPMLLDAPEEPGRAQQVDLVIPPRTDSGMETRRLPLDPGMSAPVAADARDPAAVNPLPADSGAAVPPRPAAASPSTSSTPAPPRPAPATSAPTPAPAATVTPAPSTAAPVAPATRPATAPPATAPTTAPATAPAPSPSAGGRFLAQFGSYAERANADKLVQDLAKIGIAADIETLSGGSNRSLHRVRSRAYATRAEADAARMLAQRQIAGLASTVVELASADPAQPSGMRASTSGWAVQVGVFSKREAADDLAGKLKAGGYAAFVQPVSLANGQTSHRVRIGPEVRRDNATRIQNEVKAKFKLDTLVVAHP